MHSWGQVVLLAVGVMVARLNVLYENFKNADGFFAKAEEGKEVLLTVSR